VHPRPLTGGPDTAWPPLTFQEAIARTLIPAVREESALSVDERDDLVKPARTTEGSGSGCEGKNTVTHGPGKLSCSMAGEDGGAGVRALGRPSGRASSLAGRESGHALVLCGLPPPFMERTKVGEDVRV
jgi:hypothetical protein